MTTTATSQHGTGMRTLADLAALAAEKYGDKPAARFKRDGDWSEVSFAEVGTIVEEIALGMIDLGLEPGDRVCILCNTRPEWTYADLAIPAAGGVVVPIYPTNSPAECEWVAGNSQAKIAVVEDASQLAKVRAVRDELPDLETVIVVDPSGDTDGAVPLDEVRERGRGRDAAELEQRRDGVKGDDAFTIIYTSGTTGNPKGCVLTHDNYRFTVTACESVDVLEADESTYLFLPLAHAFALLIQLLSIDLGGHLAYFGGDTKQIVPELTEVKPTYLPSVPRIFEKIYTLATAAVQQGSDEDRRRFEAAVKLGVQVRQMRQRGEEVPAELQQHFDAADEKLYKNVRALFGGRLKQAVTGAAPIAQEILQFFYACGVPVLEGYGMTETATVATISTVDAFKFGTVGRALPGVEMKIAEDGELLVKGGNILEGYYRNEDATKETVVDGWLHTGDLGAIDEDGYISITGRKKDIIITAGGKNLTPANIENDLKQSQWISQAVMYGDRRPYPVALVTLDEEEIPKFASEHGLPSDIPSLAQAPEVHELIQGILDNANRKYAQVEQVKRFAILDHDLSQETGELTPTLKVKRNVVYEKYDDVFADLYAK